MAAAKRVLRYLCSTSGMGLVLGGRSPVVLTGHAEASWADDQATQRSSQGYTFGLDNKAMLALCREQRLEHRTKHIALRYFLARELQQRGQLRLTYVASEANTADVFTKALAPCDHQRCCTQLATALAAAATALAAAATALTTAASALAAAATALAATYCSYRSLLLLLLAAAATYCCCSFLDLLLTLREWVLQRARPSGGGFGFLCTAWRRQQSQQETFSPQVLSELFPQRCVTSSVEAAALGSSESTTALGASESAAALGARASPATGPSSAEALHTFTLDSGASRCFFCDCNSLTPLAAPVPVSLADPTGGPVVARASTVLPCPAVLSGSLFGLHLPTFSTSLVSNAAIQDVWVDTFIPGGQRVAIYTCSQTGRHLATFTRRPRSSLYTLTTASAQVATAGQTLLWHHHLGHPSLPRLRGMHSRLLRAAPHSSSFPPTIAPLQTLHMDVWGPAPVGGMDQERYFLLVVDDYTRYTTVFPLRHKADVSSVLIPWIRATHRQLRERFNQDFPVLRVHFDKGSEFSSDLLAELCRDEGIVQSFTLPASPQQNGIAERRIGLIMEVACTSMVHAAAPHFLWPFAVRYAAHQLNLWPRVSEPETSPTLRWTGKAGDASVFQVWGALSLVRDPTTNKLSSRTLRCVFLGFPTDAPPWQFYHPRSRRVFSSQDVTFDESVCYYTLHPHASHPGPAPSGVSQVDPPPLVEPLEVSFDSSGLAEGGDPAADDTAATRRSPRLETPPCFPPRPSSLPPQPAAVDSGAETAGAESGGAEPEGEGCGGATTGGAGSWGAATGGADSGGPVSPSGGGAMGDPAGGPGAGQPPQPDLLEMLSPQAVREWIVRRGRPGGGGYIPAGAGAASPGGTAGARGTGGIAGAGGARATSTRGATGAGPTSPGGTASAGGAGDTAGARGAGAAGPGGARCGGTRAAGTGGAVRAGGPTGAAGSRGTGGAAGAGAAGVGGTAGAGGARGTNGAASTGGAGGTTGARGPLAAVASGAAGAGGAGGAARAAGAGGASAAGAGGAGAANTALRRPIFYPQPQSSLPPLDSVLRQVHILPSSTGLPLPLLCPPTDQSPPQLLPGSPLPTPGPHTGVTESLTERRVPETRASTPIRARRIARPRPPAVPGTHGMALRPFSVPLRVVLPEPPASSLPHVSDHDSYLARAAKTTVTRLLAIVVTNPDLESTAAFFLVTKPVKFAARSRLDYVASLVTESESVCPPSVGGELALGSDILEDRQFELECLAATLPRFASMLLCPEGDPDALDIPTPRSYAESIASEYSSQWQTAMDAEMASWKSTGTYIDEVPPLGANIVDGMWIFRVKRPSGSPLAFKARYVARGFRQREGIDFFHTFSPTPKMTTLRAPQEWHDTLRTTLAALGFAPSSADPSLFLRTDTTLPPFYILVYVDDLVFATADTEALALVKAELQERHTCTDLGELHSYLGLQITRDRAQCTITLTESHMVHQVLQRFDFQFCSPQPTPLSTGQSLSAPPSDEFVESSGPYPELVGCLIYLMTCTRPDLAYPLTTWLPELPWLTYLLTDLGERPRSPPVLYVDNKAMLALCHEQRLEHRTKHIALRYFLARELQQRRQLRLSYVASWANTADVFTKAPGSGDHQRFCTALGLVPTLPHLLVA
ncbi:unnamed protein product [Closterium sp. NIES-54]